MQTTDPVPTRGLSPDLIRTARFPVVRKGYAPAEVDALLEHVAQVIERWLADQVATEAREVSEVTEFARQAVEQEHARARAAADQHIAQAAALRDQAEQAQAQLQQERAALQVERTAVQAELARAREVAAAAEAARDEATAEARALTGLRQDLEVARDALAADHDEHRAKEAAAERARDALLAEAHAEARRLRAEVLAELDDRRRWQAEQLVARTARFLEQLDPSALAYRSSDAAAEGQVLAPRFGTTT